MFKTIFRFLKYIADLENYKNETEIKIQEKIENYKNVMSK